MQSSLKRNIYALVNLTVCYYHVLCAFLSESTLYSFPYVKELLAQKGRGGRALILIFLDSPHFVTFTEEILNGKLHVFGQCLGSFQLI